MVTVEFRDEGREELHNERFRPNNGGVAIEVVFGNSSSRRRNKFASIEKLDEESLRAMSNTLAEKAECVEGVAEVKAAEGATAQA